MQSHFMAENGPNPPPCCNTGVNSGPTGQIAANWGVDWLRLSFPESRVHEVTECLVSAGFFPSECKGKLGYSRGYAFRRDVVSTDSPDLEIWWGGDAMRERATLEASGSIAEMVFAAVSRLSVAFVVRRLDLRLDFDGVSFLTGQDAIVHVLENWPFEGVRPGRHFHDDQGSGLGCTQYVGARTGEHMIRWYEKGKQMRDFSRPNWCRFEVELKPRKADKGAVMWAMLRAGRRDDIVRSGFSAAFLPFFTGSENMEKVIIPPEVKVRDFEGRIDVMVTQYGRLLREIIELSEGNWDVAGAIIEAGLERQDRLSEYSERRAKANAKGEFLESEIPY